MLKPPVALSMDGAPRVAPKLTLAPAPKEGAGVVAGVAPPKLNAGVAAGAAGVIPKPPTVAGVVDPNTSAGAPNDGAGVDDEAAPKVNPGVIGAGAATGGC